MALPTQARRRRAGSRLSVLGLAALGFLAGSALAEAILRLAAPLLPPPVAVFVREESLPAARSALRVARGAHLVLREQDFREPVEILALGDSMVFGSLVEERDLFTTLLAAETGSRVLNLGVGSQGPCAYNHMLGVALSRLPRSPRVVLYTLFANDFREPPCRPLSDAELFYWQDEARGNLGLRARRTREWLLQHSALYQLFKRWLGFGSVLAGPVYAPRSVAYGPWRFLFAPAEHWRPLLDPALPEVSTGIARSIELARAAARRSGSGTRFVMVLMPFKEQVYLPLVLEATPAAGEAVPDFYDAAYDVVRDRASALGLECLDLRRSFREAARAGARLYWTLDGHLTPEGHRLTARVLADSLGAVGAGPERRGSPPPANPGEAASPPLPLR